MGRYSTEVRSYSILDTCSTAELTHDRSITSVALKFTYGTQVELDPTISQVQKFIAQLLRASIPGSYFADYFTSMKLLPSSIAKWKREAESSYEVNDALFKGLFEYSKGKIVSDKVLCVVVCSSKCLNRTKGVSLRVLWQRQSSKKKRVGWMSTSYRGSVVQFGE